MIYQTIHKSVNRKSYPVFITKTVKNCLQGNCLNYNCPAYNTSSCVGRGIQNINKLMK